MGRCPEGAEGVKKPKQQLNFQKTMNIQFLGTGAAEGIPALFCNCNFCRSVRLRGGKAVRSRAQVLVDGELSIDFPPDAFYHGLGAGVDLSAVRYLLVTHSHCDHFYAHDFVLRGYKYAKNMTSPALHILGNADVLSVFSESVRREMRPEVENTFSFTCLKAFSPVSFGDWTAHPLKAMHSSSEPFVFFLEGKGKRILHLTDTGPLPEESYSYLGRAGAPCDLVTLDCTFLYDDAPHSARHMGVKENAELLRRLCEMGLVDGHTRAVITHFSHNSEPTEEKLRRAEGELGVIAAYDGLTISI